MRGCLRRSQCTCGDFVRFSGHGGTKVFDLIHHLMFCFFMTTRCAQVFTPLVLKCKQLNRAMRIGTNHGSLSARILSYYGDTPR